MKNFVQPGNTITLTAPYAVASGDGLLVGSIFGVAAGTAASGEPIETALVGVFDITKVGRVAGCRVTEGVVRRGARVRIIREDIKYNPKGDFPLTLLLDSNGKVLRTWSGKPKSALSDWIGEIKALKK